MGPRGLTQFGFDCGDPAGRVAFRAQFATMTCYGRMICGFVLPPNTQYRDGCGRFGGSYPGKPRWELIIVRRRRRPHCLKIAAAASPAISAALASPLDTPRQPSPIMAAILYVQFYFITIATILGTGILGLPVTLSHSGFWPFLLPFFGSYVMQSILIIMFTELLQIAYFQKLREGKQANFEALPLDSNGETTAAENTTDSDATVPSNDEFDFENKLALDLDIPVVTPNLHMIGELFLNPIGAFCFDIVLGLGFVSVLISYALAGSQAYADTLDISLESMIPVFCLLLTLVVVFLQFIVQPVISILTLVKGCMFTGCVVITFLVGAKIDRRSSQDWGSIGEPFLMGTVAIGGIINIMPILFMRIIPRPDQIRKFNLAVIAGLTTCFALNVIWCWSILRIVPQRPDICPQPADPLTSTSQLPTCTSVSLAQSHELGEISTIPLSEVIQFHYPQYSVVSIFVQFFIMVSITVSYLTFGSAMHHMISGIMTSFWESKGEFFIDKLKLQPSTNNEVVIGHWSVVAWLKSITSILCFLAVFCVAISNPQGFIKVLDRVTSLAQNLQNCVFVPIMLVVVKSSEKYRNLSISLRLHNLFYFLYIPVTLFYGVAVLYDLYIWTKALLG